MPRVKPEQLAELVDLLNKKRKLDSESRTLESRIVELRTLAAADLEASGKDQTKRGLFVMRWIESKGRVSWKDEFIRACGTKKASQLAKNVPTHRSIDIIDGRT